MYQYYIYGLVLESALELPAYARHQLECDSENVDIKVRFSKVLTPVSSVSSQGICFCAEGTDVYVRLPRIADVAILAGRQILIQAVNGEHKEPIFSAIALFVTNHAMAIAMVQRGFLVLHAGAILSTKGVTLVAGNSGAGKSTLIASLIDNGHTLICDELCVVDVGAKNARLFPGPSSLQIWHDALSMIDHANEELTQVRPEIQKFYLHSAAHIEQKEKEKIIIPNTIVHLKWLENTQVFCEWLTGVNKFKALIDNVYRWPYINAMGLTQSVTQMCLVFASQLEYLHITRPRSSAPEDTKQVMSNFEVIP